MNKYIAEIVDQKLWIKQGDETWCYDVLDMAAEGSRRKKTSSSSPDRIVSLMPGKITKIFIKTGDSVTKGQTLIVMEAMKMEYTLKSDIESTVEIVSVELGQQVTVGQLLVQLKKV
jgi:biotin carboxyl carrier protein